LGEQTLEPTDLLLIFAEGSRVEAHNFLLRRSRGKVELYRSLLSRKLLQLRPGDVHGYAFGLVIRPKPIDPSP